jgi:hypothetical protein
MRDAYAEMLHVKQGMYRSSENRNPSTLGRGREINIVSKHLCMRLGSVGVYLPFYGAEIDLTPVRLPLNKMSVEFV